jgi:hypothetical protein
MEQPGPPAGPVRVQLMVVFAGAAAMDAAPAMA